MVIEFIKYRKLYFSISAIFLVTSLIFIILFKINFGIDFRGGSILEIEYLSKRPAISDIEKAISEFNFQGLKIRAVGEKSLNLIVKEKNISTKLVAKNVKVKIGNKEEKIDIYKSNIPESRKICKVFNKEILIY